MAKATTNFSSWSLIVTLLDSVKTFENSLAYTSVENTASNFASYLFNISNWLGTSSIDTYSNYYYTAVANGSNLDKSSANITRASISDISGNSQLLTGSVKSTGPLTSIFTLG